MRILRDLRLAPLAPERGGGEERGRSARCPRRGLLNFNSAKFEAARRGTRREILIAEQLAAPLTRSRANDS